MLIRSYFIKPHEFLDMLQEVKSNLHIGDNLPVSVSLENIYYYYNIVKVYM